MSKTIGSIKKFDDGIRLVTVNEEGDAAAISINDPTFIDRFTDFIDWFSKSGEELNAFMEDVEKNHTEEDGDINLDVIAKTARKRVELCKMARDRIDELFGEGICKKVFGVDVPDEVCIMEFVEAMIPFINDAFKERGQHIDQKYSRNRKGARSRQRTKAELIEAYGNGAEV